MVQVGRMEPAERLAFQAGGLSAPGRNEEELQVDDAVRVFMVQRHVRFSLGHVDAEFLVQLPSKGVDGALAIGDLAARKFPQAVERTVTDPFGNQDMTVAVSQNAGSNAKMIHRAAGICRGTA